MIDIFGDNKIEPETINIDHTMFKLQPFQDYVERYVSINGICTTYKQIDHLEKTKIMLLHTFLTILIDKDLNIYYIKQHGRAFFSTRDEEFIPINLTESDLLYIDETTKSSTTTIKYIINSLASNNRWGTTKFDNIDEFLKFTFSGFTARCIIGDKQLYHPNNFLYKLANTSRSKLNTQVKRYLNNKSHTLTSDIKNIIDSIGTIDVISSIDPNHENYN